jgi:DNA-binding response OmpR family regulator
MRKVLVMGALHALLEQEKTFLGRADVEVFTAATGEEALKVHRAERMDLIMVPLELPGMAGERFCNRIREEAGPARAALIMTCANTPEAIKASSRCRADAVLLEPLHPLLLVAKAQQLLYISARNSIRVALNSDVEARTSEGSFYCRTRNVSASGMLIETERLLAEGNELSCQFYVPVARQVRAAGRIVRIIQHTPGNKSFQYGLIFTEIDPDTRQMLGDYAESLSGTEETGSQ